MTAALPPAWILAGGLGTRLSQVLPDLPKALAPVGERPFLDIVLDQLLTLGIRDVVLLLGTRHEAILQFLGERRARRGAGDVHVRTSVESSPLGTGGAVKLAAHLADGPFFLMNGDTYLDFDAAALAARHRDTHADITLAASHQKDTGRFGRLDLTEAGLVRGFCEKAQSTGPGYINGGVYMIEPDVLDLIPAGRPVSLEQATFPLAIACGKTVAALPTEGDFFDIGTPQSYQAFVEYLREHLAQPPKGRLS
jgi:D-glycero-alpha-D-manno-heptose 1-phosphate guanylyltransferase